jgi:hypothetical protein
MPPNCGVKTGSWLPGGKGVQWADIGEEISVTGLIALQEERHLVDTLDV